MAEPHSTLECGWPVEHIPDPDKLFVRVHVSYCRPPPKKLDDPVPPGAFSEKGNTTNGTSADWSRHSTDADSRNRAKVPAQNGVAAFVAEDARKLHLPVVHDPIDHQRARNEGLAEPNRAHSLCQGDKKVGTPERRVLLAQQTVWRILPPPTG